MTSKNCFSRMVIRDLKERSVWLIGSMILLLFIYPIQILISLDAISSYLKGDETFYSTIAERFSSLIGPGNGVMYVVIVVMAFLLAMSGFWYLYSGVKTDFYHSLPIKREQLFFSRYLVGILIFFIPYIISVLLGYGAGMMKGAGSSGVLGLCAKSFLTNMILFLLFYNLAILGVLLTGNLFTGVLAYGAFLGYGILLDTTITLTKSYFFTTYTGNRRLLGTAFSGSFSMLSPIYVIEMILSDNKISLKKMSVVFGIALLLLVICVWIYKIRPTESYHKSIAFKKLQPVIKVAIVVPVSAFAGIMLSEIAGENFLWYLVGMFGMALLLCFAMEFLYHLDIKECIRPRISSGIILGIAVVTAVTLKLDLFRFDTYLPKESQVKNMSIYIDELNGHYEYPSGYGYYYNEFLDHAKIEKFSDIYQLAKKGVAIQKERGDVGYVTTESGMMSFSVRYELKNGKVVYRGYSVPKNEENLKLVANIYDNWEFKKKSLPVEYVEEKNILSLTISDLQSHRDSGLSKEVIKDLFKTSKNEWESATYEQLKADKVLGFLQFYVNYKDENDYGGYDSGYQFMSVPVYSSFKQTRQLLEQSGCKLVTFENFGEVQFIQIRKYDSDNGDEMKSVEFTDENQIKEILSLIHITDNNGIFDYDSLDYNIEISVHWKNGEDSQDYGNAYFRTNEVPDFVTKALEE